MKPLDRKAGGKSENRTHITVMNSFLLAKFISTAGRAGTNACGENVRPISLFIFLDTWGNVRQSR